MIYYIIYIWKISRYVIFLGNGKQFFRSQSFLLLSALSLASTNSEKTVGKEAKKEANVDSSCDYKASKSGNVIKITATCGSSGEDSRKLAESVTNVFSRAIINIYEMDGLETKVISEGSSEENVTTLKHISYIALPAFAGLAISAFIAFVKLDRATSEKRKK